MDQMLETTDAALRRRAKAVVPGGMWGHLNADRLPAGYPQFFQKGEGAYLWDADGRRFIDLMCAWGPNYLGYRHKEVEEAARVQAALGDCLNGPAPVMVELAERIVGTVAAADWAMFQKNGTDATTACCTIARAATGRRKILVARGAYHGAVPWCSPSLIGVTAEDRAHLVHYDYNDADSLARAVESAKGDLAGVVVSAFKHDYGLDQALPAPEFAKTVRALCDGQGAALILDEVRAGFRLDLAGSWEPLGVRPDLSAFSKALANGHALAAVTGAEWLRDAASRIFVTGSFWAGAVAMAAANATLEVARRDGVPAELARLGTALRQGLDGSARKVGLRLSQTGPVQMPTVLFADDPDFRKGNAFCLAMLREGVYLHPRHNMFLCAAHTDADVRHTVEAAGRALAAVAEAEG